MKKISIGISAYNEGRNINKLLKQIFSQTQKNWTLSEIILNCDGCTDNTVSEAKKIQSRKVKILNNKDRKGKPYRLQEIFQKITGDIVIVFDADIKLADKNVISKLIKYFENDSNLTLAGGNTRPFLPKGFFENAVYSTFKVFDDSRNNLRGGNNLFGFTGACMVLKSEFAKSIKFPKVINEDDFIYLTCKKRKLKYIHIPEAIVYYKLPNNLLDYLKQVFRSNPEAVHLNFRKYFGNLVDREYERPAMFYIKSVIKELVSNPIPTVFIITVNTLCIPFFPLISKNYKQSWFTAESTK